MPSYADNQPRPQFPPNDNPPPPYAELRALIQRSFLLMLHSSITLSAIDQRLQGLQRAYEEPAAYDEERAAALTLSPREMQVLRLLARSMTNTEIGAELGIRPSTVKNHVSSILNKLIVHDRAAAVKRAQLFGLV